MKLNDKPNDIVLMLEDGTPSHFKLREFANEEGVAIVNPLLLFRLELLRNKLAQIFGEEIWIIITDATRTQRDNERLAEKYGWYDEGGAVARDSKHLTKYGGIAVDIKAFKAQKDKLAGFRGRVSQAMLGRAARDIFPYVKDDYADGHVHVDCWDRSKGEIA